MAAIKKVIDAILKWLSIILMGGTALLVVWQVVTRYVLKNPELLERDCRHIWFRVFGNALWSLCVWTVRSYEHAVHS